MKKLLLALLLIPTLAFGQAQQDNWYVIEDFSGMLKSHISSHLVPKGSAKQALNVRVNEEYGALTKRSKMLQLSACRAFAVKSIHRYYKSDDTAYIIQNSSTFMDSVNETTGACTSMATGLSDGKRWSWLTYKDVAIGTDGTDNVKKWDGKTQSTANTDASRTAGDLIADLGAPFAEQNTGSNLDASSWYQYKIAYYDDSVYKFSNGRSNPILTGSSVRDITLTDIPLGPSGTTSRIIYRTEGQASRAAVVATSSFYRVATISDNSTRTYNDAVSDATLLGDLAPTWATASAGTNVTPPKGKLSLIHKDRLFIANDPSVSVAGKSTIYWSDILNPDYFNYNTDYELIRPDDGDEITFIKNLLGILTIGKTNTIQKFYTDEVDNTDWTISAPFSFIGCPAIYTAVNTNLGIFYLGRHGIYSFGGQNSELVSDVVSDKIRDILETNYQEAVAVYHDNQYLLAYTSSESGASSNDHVLILDLVRNSYVEDTKNIDSWAAFEAGLDFGTLYSGSSTTSGAIYAHSGSFNNLIYRYKSQFDAGTVDSVYVGGSEDDPYLRLGWDSTWSTAVGTWGNQGSATWLVKESPGYWYSPIIQIDANTLDKLYWNEDLGTFGDVVWQVRTGASSGAVSAASWSSDYSSPSGSDISGLTANTYIQLRAKLSTTDFTESPEIFLENSFVAKLTYTKEGSTGETSILSIWKGNKTNFDAGESPKRIKEIQVYYTGTSGTVNFALDNNEGGTLKSFDINLATAANASTTDQYFGNTDEKIFVYIPSVDNTPVGRRWQFTVTENGTQTWKINRVAVRFENTGYVTFK